MANWHGYILVEVPPGFTATDRRAAYDAIRALGPLWSEEEIHAFTPVVWVYNPETEEWEETGGDPITIIRKYHHNQPAIMNHSRESLNGGQIIIEAEFDEDEITRDAIVDLVASATGLPRPPIEATMQYQIFAEGKEWMESGDACRAYLAANRDDWEEETP